MESLQNLKKRLKSVGNIKKITKAMEMVSATKMRRAQEVALSSRPYAFAALELLANLSALEHIKKEELPDLFLSRSVKKVLFVLVASDKGLAGAFNSSVFRKFEKHLAIEKEEWKKEEHVYMAVGEKAFTYLQKKNIAIVKKFTQAGDFTTVEQIQPLSEFILEGYKEKLWDRVVIISTHFLSALKQEPHVRRILPVDFDHIKQTVQEIIPERGKFADLIKEQNLNFVPNKQALAEYLIEPSPRAVLEKLAKHLLFMQLYHIVLEANASEHSARRLAMKNASDNAGELSEELNLQYNKSRQAGITNQIIEISAGAESLN